MRRKSLFINFYFFGSGNFVSSVGSGLTSFGLGVYIFKQTGRASLMALVTLLAFLPSLLLSVPAGVLADRYDRRILMVLGDSLSAWGLLYILLCLMQGEAQIWQICVGVTVSSVFASLLEPAYKSTITDLLTAEQFSKASAGAIGRLRKVSAIPLFWQDSFWGLQTYAFCLSLISVHFS